MQSTDLESRAFDIAIVGGGPVGVALALALRESGLRVVLLDARGTAVNDRRAIALSFGTRLFFERLGVWDALAATPIESIHVSQRGGFGRTLMTAEQCGRPALGYVCSYDTLHRTLNEALQDASTVTLVQPAKAEAIAGESGAKTISVRYADRLVTLHARLAVLADGGALAGSLTRQVVRDYAQSALTATVTCDTAHHNRAYERFTPDGPMALLPNGRDFALVWTLPPEAGKCMLDEDEQHFLAQAQAAFGTRAGRFLSVRERGLFPLALRFATHIDQDGVIALGNASQTLHPVAGQGLNLGLRDAAALFECIANSVGDERFAALSRRFARARAADRIGTIALTDVLASAFANDIAPVRIARACGLALLDILPPAKRAFADRMMFGA